jgi:hypothetical protein
MVGRSEVSFRIAESSELKRRELPRRGDHGKLQRIAVSDSMHIPKGIDDRPYCQALCVSREHPAAMHCFPSLFPEPD